MESFADPLDLFVARIMESLDKYPELADRLSDVLSERKKKAQAVKQPDVGTPQDVDRRPLSSERVTFGGLLEPNEDDRQADLVGEYYSTLGGLTLPDKRPALTGEALKMAQTYDRWATLFFEKPQTGLSPEEKRRQTIRDKARSEGRDTVGGLGAPEQ